MIFKPLLASQLVSSIGSADFVWVIGQKSSFLNSRQLKPIFKSQTENFENLIHALPEKLDEDQDHHFAAQKKGAPSWALTTLAKDYSSLELLEKLRQSAKSSINHNYKNLVVICLEKKDVTRLAHSLGVVLANLTATITVYGQRTKKEKKFQLGTVQLMTLVQNKQSIQAAHEGFIEGQGTHMVRELGMRPSNLLSAKIYGEYIAQTCKEHQLRCKLHSNKELKKMGAGAFTAVDQAHPNSHGGIWEIEYKPQKSKNKKPIALVGKGLCFDTGGYDVKTGNGMVTMKGDMQGSAVALAVMITAKKLKLPLHLKAYLAVTENHISPTGYKADDLVYALNGLTIEVVDTDAEGRMVLADALTLATKDKPQLCIDFATLTGAAIRSIGKRYAAGFANNQKFHSQMIQAGQATGERVWPFPLDKDFEKAIESPIADVLQCPKGPGPDHIWAACFLSKFVAEKVPWVHIDLAAAESEGGLGPCETLFTGFGVRWALRFLRDQKLQTK